MKLKKIAFLLGATSVACVLASCSVGMKPIDTTTTASEDSNTTTTTTEENETFTLKELKVSLSKENYYLGEELSFSFKGIYTSSKTGEDKEQTLPNGFSMALYDAAGNIVELSNATSKEGTYTVTISLDGKTQNITYTVAPKTYSSIEDAVEGVAESYQFIKGGEYTVVDWGVESVTQYKLGEDFATYRTEYAEDDYYELTYDAKDDEDVVVFGKSPSGIEVTYIYGSSINDIVGVGVDVIGDYHKDAYGAEQALDAIYSLKDEAVYYEEEQLADAFAFSMLVFNNDSNEASNYVYYDVSFTTGSYGELTQLSIVKKEYDASDVTVNEDNTYSISEEASPYQIEMIFDQETGAKAKSEDNELALKKVSISNFSVSVGESEIDYSDVSIDLENGNVTTDEGYKREKIEYVASYDENENTLGLDNVEAYVTGVAYDGTQVDTRDDYVGKYVIVSWGTTNVTFMLPGEYVVHFKSLNLEKTVKVSVAAQSPVSMDMQVYENLNANSSFTSLNEYDMYMSNEVYVLPVIDARYDQNVTIASNNDALALSKATVTTASGRVEAYKLSATAAGTYTITVTSTKNSAKTKTITINVLETPDVSLLFAGTYQANNGADKYLVTFNADNTATITNKADETKVESLTWSYSENGIVFRHVDGENYGFDLDINAKYQLGLIIDDNFVRLVEPTEDKEEEETGDFSLVGIYEATASFMGMNITYTFEITEDSMVVAEKGKKSGTYTYSVNAVTGEVTFELESGTDQLSGKELKVENNKLILTCFGNDWVCKKDGAAEEEEPAIAEIPEKFVGTWEYVDGDVTTTIVITTEGITFDGSALAVDSITETSITASDSMGNITLTLTEEGLSDGAVVFTKKVAEDTGVYDAHGINVEWYGSYDDGTGYIVTIDETGINYEGLHTDITVNGNVITFGGYQTLTINADGTITDGLGYTYTKQ